MGLRLGFNFYRHSRISRDRRIGVGRPPLQFSNPVVPIPYLAVLVDKDVLVWTIDLRHELIVAHVL